MASTLRSARAHSTVSSRPVRSSRTHVQSYNEDSGPEEPLDEDVRSDIHLLRRHSVSLRPRDSNRIPVSYREDSSDDDIENGRGDNPDVVLPSQAPQRTYASQSTPTRPTRPSRSRTVKTRSQTRRTKRTPTKRQFVLGRPLHKRRKVEEEGNPFLISSGVIPPWQTLPYHILLDIFLRASYPLVNERSAKRNPSVNWLVDVALLCRGFHEPALAALYLSPPLMPATKSHGLLSLLAKPQDLLSINYVNKIQELHVDVETILVYKSGPTLGYFDLPKLLEYTPQVKTLRLYHNDDYVVGLPPWQMPRSKWVYPEALFTSISASSMRLYRWDWNARFMETQGLLPLMLACHRLSSFQSIQELRILHVSSEDADGDEVIGVADEREDVLSKGLAELAHLRRLEFLESSILNDHLLPKLPSNLTSLTINNCDDVTTTNFSLFLSSHGRTLRELSLSHNRHLSLSFIVGLKEFCQNLENFTMDVSMHDWSSFHDVEPHFDELLSPSEIPTWPATLQRLELIQLRKWDEKTAEAFFASLIEAAPELANLRRLVISAILKTGWRDRASFREKWIGRLEKVFLRQSTPPNPTRGSIQKKPKDLGSSEASAGRVPDEGQSPKRKSVRIANRKHSDSEDDHTPSPRSARTREAGSDYDLPATQGMCDVVVIRIDNQRPRETQFNEGDFLDDELSGDEDWNGRDVDLGGGSHAW
ncbi:uncharacterized protein BJX67DRAFT_349063 [Aspergillus lucknowensis]|uniref:F-box domain-containing protein n=1 Tax=Aspergillus lucknowensis TaxID=176173 RepID=A0ABR4LW47_9EURO